MRRRTLAITGSFPPSADSGQSDRRESCGACSGVTRGLRSAPIVNAVSSKMRDPRPLPKDRGTRRPLRASWVGSCNSPVHVR